MRILCDACESAAAIVFCAADEAALCCSCDQKVHMCNKLASRHVRVGLADPSNAPSCDICENAPAFFYCEIDGTSLCLQCDMVVHVGGKRTHRRFLLLRQRIEFPGDKPNHADDLGLRCKEANRQNISSSGRGQESNGNGDHNMIDLNSNPQRVHEPGSNHQEQGIDVNSTNNHEPVGVVPVGAFKRES
ncbi:hypothetical protein N665_0005s0131 [Sinapis alba]|nr:hypothetical protein N665_0005s0131 [Sinapis alba]